MNFESGRPALADLAAVAAGALLTSVDVGFFDRQRCRLPFFPDLDDRWSAVAGKKLVELAVLGLLIAIGAGDLLRLP